MKGDFSRQTFNPLHHYTGVLQQQGRVQLDADWNEQQLIALRRDETSVRDLVGPAGAPRVEAGFGITPTGPSLSIGRGHFYLDGIQCINESDILITAQPDLPGFVLPTSDGVYLAYLEVWRRHLSAAERPDLREKALGGPDTATRVQTISQVKLLVIDSANPTCEGNLPEWNALLGQRAPDPTSAGKMAARTANEAVTSDPACILPPSAGFKGLENQLYRVEIHTGGDRATARFKWSRENGSVATPVTKIAGLTLTVESTGGDEKLAFAANQWVEVTDDALELAGQRGGLFLINNVNPATREITLNGGALPALALERHPVIRRWDQRGADGTADGIPLNGADWIALEDGIQVHFEAGVYKPGDYWLIPARSSVSIETGKTEWPSPGGVPSNLPSQGNDHHFARLALLRRAGGVWSLLQPGTDCRKVFPPLTAITAADVSFDNTVCHFDPAATTVQAALDDLCRTRHCACTIIVRPGDDVQQAFDQLGNAHNALVCFQVGDYRVDNTVVVAGKGHLRVTGCGPGTRLFSARNECVLRFERCASVSLEAVAVDGGPVNQDSIHGAVTFIDCPVVAVRSVRGSTQGFGERRTAAITVRNSPKIAPGSIARITGCDLFVGHFQIGILLVNVGRSFVGDNVIRVAARPSNAQLLTSLDYRARLRKNLLTTAFFGALPNPVPAGVNASVTLGTHSVHFHTLPALTTSNRANNAWQTSIANTPPASVNSPHALFRLLERKANRALLAIPENGLAASIRNAAQGLLNQDTVVGSQGIVVAGVRADDVQIVRNLIEEFVQGIHLGLSHRGNVKGDVDVAGQVRVHDNTIRLRIGPSSTHERHGIFAGNFSSLNIAGNHVAASRTGPGTTLRTEGIRLFGHAGARLTVKENHLERFDVGIAFTTLAMPAPRLWVITHNLAANATETVRAFRKTARGLQSIRGEIRGVNDNVP